VVSSMVGLNCELSIVFQFARPLLLLSNPRCLWWGAEGLTPFVDFVRLL
jgi:hypothetical protein